MNIALHAASIAADCDFVISGPNVGHNAGRSNLMSSGTVGAAKEAAIARRPAVAMLTRMLTRMVSASRGKHWTRAAPA